MKYIPFFLFLFGVFEVSDCNGQTSDTLVLTLPKATNIAIENNLTLRDQNLDVDIAETQVDQTKAQGLPQINASFDYQYTVLNAFASRTSSDEGSEFIPSGEVYQGFTPQQSEVLEEVAMNSIGAFFSNIGDAFASKHASTAAVALNQKVFDGVYLLGLQAAEVYVDLASIQTEPTERDIEKAVEKAYYGALITQENIDIIDKNIQNIEQLLHETEEIYKAGFVEQLDVDRLVLSLSTLRNQRKNLEKINQFNYDILKNSMNVSLGTNIIIEEDIESFAEIATSDEILEQIASPELWPEFQVLEIQEKINDLEIERIKKERLPKVDAFVNGSYGYQGNDFIFSNGFNNWFPNLITGLTISFPIFDGNLKKHQIREKQIQAEKLALSRETLQTNINLEIENSVTNYLNAKSDVESQLENIALAEKIYNTTQIKYREGVGSSLEMNQAEQDLFQAQQTYISSLYDLLIAKVDLEKALGK